MADNRHIIIVAGGKGSRMGSETPKQFLKLRGKPILMHTVDAFLRVYPDIGFVIVLPPDQISYWKELCEEYSFEVPHRVVEGGATRFESSNAGIKAIDSDEGIIGIHDAVRPLVTPKTIKNAFEGAEKEGAAIPVLEIKDSLRKTAKGDSKAVDRQSYRIVQTPQCFRADILKDAFHIAGKKDYTDDATVVENAGHPIKLVEGNIENIKITKPFDMKVAELLVQIG